MTTLARASALALLVLAALPISGCRGMKSGKPPIHPNLNMDFQQRLEAQEPNAFFADNAAQRQPVAGTVRRGGLQTSGNAPFTYGRDASGTYVAEIPVEVTSALLQRGQERYGIYCSVCHGLAGDGRGIIAVGNGGQGYGFAIPSYHTEGLKARPDGYIYDVILNGVNTMPSYGHEMPPSDRWAVVAYVRALQLSQDAGEGDVPVAERERLATYNPNVTLQN